MTVETMTCKEFTRMNTVAGELKEKRKFAK